MPDPMQVSRSISMRSPTGPNSNLTRVSVIDADAHVNEDPLAWTSSPRRHPGWLGDRRSRPADGSPRSTGSSTPARTAGLRRAGRRRRPTRARAGAPATETGLDTRLADMDAEGIDVQVLFGGLVIGVTGYDDAGFALDVCRAYDDWLLTKVCGHAPDRLKGVAVVPAAGRRPGHRRGRAGARPGRRRRDDPAGAGRPQPRRPVAAAVLRGVRRARPRRRRALGAGHEPRRCPGPGGSTTTRWCTRCRSRSTRWWRSPPSPSAGVLDRFPALRVAFLESGVGWVPYFVHRLHEHHEKLPHLLGGDVDRPAGHPRAGPVLLLLRGRGAAARDLRRAPRRRRRSSTPATTPTGTRLPRHRRGRPPPGPARGDPRPRARRQRAHGCTTSERP